ncbi:MAG: carboxypeptidase-like regulatory domain-containing protein, partial [Acidobacteriota bacterium]
MKVSRSLCRSALVLLLGMTFLAFTAHAQNIFGSIIGTVSDPSGAVLPGASVTATNLGTGEKRTATTNGQGSYQLLSLPTGNYKVEVDAPSFK